MLGRPSEESESGQREWSAVSNAADRAGVRKSFVSLEETGRKGPIKTKREGEETVWRHRLITVLRSFASSE